MIYLIKLTHQKDANLILTRKCFTIAIKTIQLSSHIIKHDEFIKATLCSEKRFETNNIFAIRSKNPFLFQSCQKLQQNKFQDQTVSVKDLFLE